MGRGFRALRSVSHLHACPTTSHSSLKLYTPAFVRPTSSLCIHFWSSERRGEVRPWFAYVPHAIGRSPQEQTSEPLEARGVSFGRGVSVQKCVCIVEACVCVCCGAHRPCTHVCVHVCILSDTFPSCRSSSLGCCIGMQASDTTDGAKCCILVPGPQLSLTSGHPWGSSSIVLAPVPPALFADLPTALSQQMGP